MPPTLASPPAPSSAAVPAASSTAPYEDDEKLDHEEDELTPAELTLEEAKRKFEIAKRYVDLNFRQLWDDCYAVYKRRRVLRHYEGVSDPVIPESFTIIETLVAQIAGGDPAFHFVKTNEEQTDDTDVLNGLLDYYTACNQMGLKNQEWVREALLYGTAILHVTWRDGKPFIDNIPLRDFFVDPNASSMVSSGKPVARYAGFQYLASKEVLRNSQIYDASQDKMVPKYKNIEEMGNIPVGQDGQGKFMDKVFKDMFQGSTLGPDALDNQVHVILLYDLDSGKQVEIGNGKEFIYYDDIQYQREEETREVDVIIDGNPSKSKQTLDAIDPFIPFAVLRDYIDTSLFYGEGEMAVLLDRAEMLNDLEAMDTDNIAYQNTPMYQIDPQFADLAPEIETIPGAIYPVPKGALAPIERPQLGQDLDIKKDRVMQQMRSATAADEAVQGISQEKGRTTATEVSTEISQAQNRFSTKIKNLQDEGYAQLGSILFKMVQIFVTEKQAVRIVGPQGVYFKDYDPWEFNGEWEPHVELDSTIKQKQLEVGQKLNQVFQVMANSPVYNPIEVQRFIIQHIDPDLSDESFNKMLAPQAPPGPSPEEQKLSTDIQKAELSAVASIYQYASPFIKSEIETILHMQPDPAHEVEEEHAAIQTGAQQADLLNPHTTADNELDPSIPPLQPVGAPEGMGSPTPAAAPA
jgi:hypothetical protein